MILLRVLLYIISLLWFLAAAEPLDSSFGFFELCSTRSPSASGHIQQEHAKRHSSKGHACERGIGTVVWHPDGFLPKNSHVKYWFTQRCNRRKQAFTQPQTLRPTCNAGWIFFLLPSRRCMVRWMCRTDRRRDRLRQMHRRLDFEPRSLLGML